MRDISPAMRAALDAEAATLCHAWLLLRRDGVALGFTDHDEDLVVAGRTYSAAAALDAGEAQSFAGPEPGDAQIAGALVSAAITEQDLANGLYDGATVETWLVDWSAPETRLLLDVATLGDVARGDLAFTARLRGLADALEQETGRRFQRACTADLGDAQCGIDLADARFRLEGEIAASPDGARALAAAGAFAASFFTGGRFHLLTGENAGATLAVKAHRREGETAIFEFWTPPAAPLAAGDRFRVVAGCDKSFRACGETFGNRANFRGFPHMPDEAIVLARAAAGAAAMDGGSLFR